METTINEIVQLSWLLVDIGVPITTPTRLYCDEKSVIQIARNLVFHEWTKHIDINCHTTRRKLQLRTMTLFFVFSSMQIVDFFTKSQIVQRFFFFWQILDVFYFFYVISFSSLLLIKPYFSFFFSSSSSLQISQSLLLVIYSLKMIFILVSLLQKLQRLMFVTMTLLRSCQLHYFKNMKSD